MKASITLTTLVFCWLSIAACKGTVPNLPETEPTPTPMTIYVDGQVIELIPGENILPEIYEAAKSPEMLENSDWVFVDGYWDLMPKGVSIPLEVEEPLLDGPTAPLYPGFPQRWDTFSMPTLGLDMDYPLGWRLETLERGIRMTSEDGSTWTSVETYPNPVKASLKVWLAEYAPPIPGELIGENEVFILGEPAVYQQVFLAETEGIPSGDYLYLWMVSEQWAYHWTAWPGEQPETYDFLMYVASTLRR